MIRSMLESEIDLCVSLIKESNQTVADEFGFTVENAPRFVAFATTNERLIYHMKIEHRPMYVYLEDDKIVGYYSLEIQDNNRCELNNLCVLPSYRHKHIGESLLLRAFKAAKMLKCEIMQIGIVEENQKLRKWYESLGFVHTGTKKFDFFPFTCGYMERAI